jgi:hypothetical protein
MTPYAPESVSVVGAGLPTRSLPVNLTPSIICKRTGAGRPFSISGNLEDASCG